MWGDPPQPQLDVVVGTSAASPAAEKSYRRGFSEPAWLFRGPILCNAAFFLAIILPMPSQSINLGQAKDVLRPARETSRPSLLSARAVDAKLSRLPQLDARTMKNQDDTLSHRFQSWCLDATSFAQKYSADLDAGVKHKTEELQATITEGEKTDQEISAKLSGAKGNLVKEHELGRTPVLKALQQKARGLKTKYHLIQGALHDGKVLLTRNSDFLTSINQACNEEKLTSQGHQTFLLFQNSSRAHNGALLAREVPLETILQPFENQRRKLEQLERFCVTVASHRERAETQRRQLHHRASKNVEEFAKPVARAQVVQQKREHDAAEIEAILEDLGTVCEGEQMIFSERATALEQSSLPKDEKKALEDASWQKHKSWDGWRKDITKAGKSVVSWIDEIGTRLDSDTLDVVEYSIQYGPDKESNVADEMRKEAEASMCDLPSLRKQLKDVKAKIATVTKACEKSAACEAFHECERPAGWCEGLGQTFKQLDCDGDGVLDYACQGAGSEFGTINSLNTCQDNWPQASPSWCPPLFACKRPAGWCEGPTDKYFNVDCDGDGLKDHACESQDNRRSTIQSLNKCQDTAGDTPISMCKSVFSCQRPSDWCKKPGSLYQQVDCDGDGVLDHACQNGDQRSTILSLDGCIDTEGRAPVNACPSFFTCQRPKDWCTAAGLTYSQLDCDDDGAPDHVCIGSKGNQGTIRSGANCVSDWPIAVNDACPKVFK